jgi:hypothetical protein
VWLAALCVAGCTVCVAGCTVCVAGCTVCGWLHCVWLAAPCVWLAALCVAALCVAGIAPSPACGVTSVCCSYDDAIDALRSAVSGHTAHTIRPQHLHTAFDAQCDAL